MVGETTRKFMNTLGLRLQGVLVATEITQVNTI